MPTTEAIKRAKTKYEQNLNKVNAMIDKQIYNQMLEYCEQKDITKKAFIEAAIAYYLDRH